MLDADDDLLALDRRRPQRGGDPLDDSLGELDQRELVGDLDRADVADRDPRLVDDCADQVGRADPGLASRAASWRNGPPLLGVMFRTPMM